MSVTALFAIDRAGGFGLRGGLPWRCPADLAHFRRVTAGGVLIAGRRTIASLPELPGRDLLAIASSAAPRASGDACLTCPSLDDAAAFAAAWGKRAFLIGGASTLTRAAQHNLLNRAIITLIDGEHEADVHLQLSPWLVSAGFTKPPYAILQQRGCTILYFEK